MPPILDGSEPLNQEEQHLRPDLLLDKDKTTWSATVFQGVNFLSILMIGC